MKKKILRFILSKNRVISKLIKYIVHYVVSYSQASKPNYFSKNWTNNFWEMILNSDVCFGKKNPKIWKNFATFWYFNTVLMDLLVENPGKRVVFSSKLRILGSSGVKHVDMETEYYDMKDLFSSGRSHLRTPIDRDSYNYTRLNPWEIALLIVVAVILFIVIWYICYTVLLVEIDTQVNNFIGSNFVKKYIPNHLGEDSQNTGLFFLWGDSCVIRFFVFFLRCTILLQRIDSIIRARLTKWWLYPMKLA